MMFELPDEFKISPGGLNCSMMDTGAVYLVFTAEDDEAWQIGLEGHITGIIIPAQVSRRHLDQVLGEIRDLGGVRFVVTPRTDGGARSGAGDKEA